MWLSSAFLVKVNGISLDSLWVCVSSGEVSLNSKPWRDPAHTSVTCSCHGSSSLLLQSLPVSGRLTRSSLGRWPQCSSRCLSSHAWTTAYLCHQTTNTSLECCCRPVIKNPKVFPQHSSSTQKEKKRNAPSHVWATVNTYTVTPTPQIDTLTQPAY